MVTLRLLGPLDLRDENGRELRRLLGQPKRLAVLAYLAGNAPQVFHRRDRLLAIFWPESSSQQARHGLRQILYELGKHLGEKAILRRGAEEIALNPEVVTSDVAQLFAALEANELEKALDLYRGTFLDAFFLTGAPEVDHWIDARRAEIRRRVQEAAWRLVEEHEAAGDRPAAARVARRAVALAPTDEDGVRSLLSLLHRQGNRGDALRVYDRLSTMLVEEYGAEPSAETRALVDRIRRSEGTAPENAQSPPVESARIEESPTPNVGAPPRFSGGAGKVRSRLVAALLISAALFGGWIVARGQREPSSAGTLFATDPLHPRARVLVADFGSAPPDPVLSSVVAELLRIDLSQSTAVRPLDPSAIEDGLGRMRVAPDTPLDQALALELALREGAQGVLVGEVTRVGSSYVISARMLAPASGDLLLAARATSADEDGLIRAIDSLSAAVRERIGESLRDVRASAPLERVTTASLPALYRYSQALGPERFTDGQRTAVGLLQEAVALDPGFAMAHRRLSVVLLRLGRVEESEAAARRAYEARERLPETERHLVTASYFARWEYDPDRAEAEYRGALDRDPENQVALTNLAALHTFTREWQAREQHARRSLEAQPSLVAFLNLFNALLLQGQVDRAEQELSASAERTGAPASANLRFDLEIARRDYDAAERIMTSADVGMDRRRLGDVLLLRGRIGAAERLYREGLARLPENGLPGPRWEWQLRLAALSADHRSTVDALAALEAFQPEELPISDQRLLERAALYATLGRVERARALVRTFENEVGTGPGTFPAIRSAAARANGEIAFAEGRFADAAQDFQTVNEFSGGCVNCGLARRAEALRRAGRTDDAIVELERISTTPTAGLDPDDARWLPRVYESLGELYEARGDTARALEAFDSFVALWQDADAVLQARVEVARRRAAALRR